jgi:serine/threonine protein kinase/tetratricopeptide (TPR) repeat protein
VQAEFKQVKQIFLAAVEKAGPEERAAYLREACGGDAALRRQVEALLRQHEQAGSFLERPAVEEAGTGAYPPNPDPDARSGSAGDEPALSGPIPEGPGSRVGPYKLLQKLGEGGMGAVWVAEQTEPVKRRVALKVIKPGLDSAQLLRRFEAERQALALMDHSNIAKVLDAGTTEAGRPYFVMELVHGVPLTRYCDELHLPVRERLGLFVAVCQAVQHAHQKGVIHRDLKPSNVLVCMQDGRPVPKVIDFGVAKALHQRLTEGTLFTEFGAVVGTLEYMSPEQAEMSPLGVDTRADVYALGVLLYELLTGTTPLDRKRLGGAALAEMLRIIKEEEPPKPSTRLTDAKESLAGLAALRRTEPARLTKLVRGELDWIVMKCLEKDRNRRYETANGLARDLQRYLADEPVEACPPSAAYRLTKFARKHRNLLGTAAAFLALLLVGGALATWQAVRLARAGRDQAERERDRAVQQAKRNRDVHEALRQAAALREQARSAAGDLGRWAEARAMAGRAEALLESGPAEPGLAEQVGALLRQLGEEEADRRMVATLDEIRLRQAEFWEGHADTQAAPRRYREAFRRYGLDPEALEVAEAAGRVGRSRIREELLAALDNWAWSTREGGAGWARLRAVADAADDNGWRRALREARARKDGGRLRKLAADDAALAQPAPVLVLLSQALQAAGSSGEVVTLLRQAQQRHPGDFWINHGLANALALMRPPRIEEAVGYCRAAVALRPDRPEVRINLGVLLMAQGDRAGGAACFRRAVELDPKLAQAHFNLGGALSDQGDAVGAVACYHQAIALDPQYAPAHFSLGTALRKRGDLAGAAACFRRAIELDPGNAFAHYDLGNVLYRQGDLPGAAATFRKALALSPKDAKTHNHLGSVLQKQGDVAGAAACYRRAIECDPKYAMAHNNLGLVLAGQGESAGAVASFRRALELDPKYADAHVNLGGALQARGDLAGAAACYRRAIELDPQHTGAHCNLGHVLIGRGELAEALAAFQTGHELGARRPGWTYPSARWVGDAKRLLEREPQLPDLLSGRLKPAGNAERFEFARLCLCKKRYATAARLLADAFAAEPNLADDLKAGHRYTAACCAALAGCGQGQGVPEAGGPERARWRRQALTWLRADLALRLGQLASGTPAGRAEGRRALRHWQQDTGLAGLRDAAALAALPADEQPACRQLWADVEALLATARDTD